MIGSNATRYVGAGATYVNPTSIKATCYRQPIGRRSSELWTSGCIRKEIFLYPLSATARMAVRRPRRPLGETKAMESPTSWAHADSAASVFYDNASKSACIRLAEDFRIP